MRLEPQQIKEYVRLFLAEDIGRGDHTTNSVVPPSTLGKARIETRVPAVIAGLDVAKACFDELGEIAWSSEFSDGDSVPAMAPIARIEGSLAVILTAERTALNLLQRLSGIATLTSRYVEAIAGTGARIVDTRKTTPGLRNLEKYAVRCGGGSNHRFGLDDGILIKDNHIAAVGSIAEAVERARKGVPHGLKIEIEVTDLNELDEAVASGADAVLLDNMTPEMVRDAVARAGGKVLLEASGGMSLDTVHVYAAAGVDLISVGALTHSAPSIDISLEVES
jgi:nicotinate-nucleotide pyrophosphorylase (carboxylating)